MRMPGCANERWSLGFVSDAFIYGRRFRVLAVVDDDTREGLAPVANASLSGLRDERLNEMPFSSLAQARTAIADWRDDYNERRSHAALGNVPPAGFPVQGILRFGTRQTQASLSGHVNYPQAAHRHEHWTLRLDGSFDL